MAWLFLKVHALVVWCVWGLARLLGRSVGRFLLAVWLLLHEEVRRYFGLAVWGVVIVLAGKATLNLDDPSGAKRSLLFVVLLVLGIWALAVRRATRITRHNSLVKVQQRKAFRDLSAEVTGTRRDMTEGLARATRNTPAKTLFRSNRKDIAKEQERAAKDAAEAEERATQEAFLDSLPPDHDPYVRSRP